MINMDAESTVETQSPGSLSADSYLGSLISLTSNSEIRYEGVLFNINTAESSIGLRNVRSFGTEGRKKDGLQIPPSDKSYEYILFRGSDIKDLQVKSSPLVQTNTHVYNDPAIIQTHYTQAMAASTNSPCSGIVSVPDVSVHSPQMGLSRPTFECSLPLYQPLGSLGSWGSSPPPPTNNGDGNPMKMYWQGFPGSSNGFQSQQQSLLMPLSGLPMPASMQQPLPYPTMNTPLSVGSSVTPISKPTESPSVLFPPLSMATLNLQSSMFPNQPSALVSDSPSNLILNKAPTETLHTSFPLVSSLPTAFDETTILLPVSDNPKTGPSPARTSGPILNEGEIPPLITPGQLLKPGPTIVSSFPPSQTAQRDVEVVQVSSFGIPPSTAFKKSQEPILPLPAHYNHKLHGAHAFPHQSYRGGRKSSRGYRMTRPVTRFTEDFDFTAMNEKFNKDEVWGDLGKSKKAVENAGASPYEDDLGASPCDIKTVYVKDDFFDSLSCDALDHGMRNGRTRFSEQMRKDTETFGYSPRLRGWRGRRPSPGGHWNGSYRGGGYGYVGHGRGHHFS